MRKTHVKPHYIILFPHQFLLLLNNVFFICMIEFLNKSNIILFQKQKFYEPFMFFFII